MANNRDIVMLTADRQIDRRILLQADSLTTAGWKVTILAMPLDEQVVEVDQRIVRINAQQSGASREHFVWNTYRWIRRALPMNGPMMRFLKRLAWRYGIHQETFFINLFARTLGEYSPAIIVAHDLPMLPVARIAAENCGAKIVFDSHELYSEQEFSRWQKSKWAEVEAKHIGACDVIMTVNQSIAQALEHRYGIRDVHVISNAERSTVPPLKSRRFHEAFSLDPSQKILLYQGGLSAGRHLDTLVCAMRLLKNPEIVLVIMGEGKFQQKLKSLVCANQLQQKVFFHQAVPQKDLLEYTAAAEVGIIPYQATCLNNALCTPNKLYEFIAAGLPIVASDLVEIRNLIVGQGIGAVGDMRSSQTMAECIDRFFADKTQLATWQERVMLTRQSICWEVEAKKLVKIYEALR